MKLTDEQFKEITDFLNERIKGCPACHKDDFELWDSLHYKEGVRDGIDEMIPFFLLICNNCGFNLEFLAEKSKLFTYDSKQRRCFVL